MLDITTNGGRREGAGRKKGYSPKKAAELMEDAAPAEGDDTTAISTNFAKAKARKEAALADMHELNYKIKMGEYVSRDSVRRASATLLAMVAQGLRSLPDSLERKIHLSPEVTQEIEREINLRLKSLQQDLAIFTNAAP